MVNKKSIRGKKSIILRVQPSWLEYGVLGIPHDKLQFLPAPYVDFHLERSNLRPYNGARVTSNGNYVTGRLKEWYEENSVKSGDTVKLSKLGTRRYRLSKK
jgi:hypothetical protein